MARPRKLRVTMEHIEFNCIPRITERDKRIIKFVADHRIVSRDHVAGTFFAHCKAPEIQTDKRLKVLYSLSILNRFFPPRPPAGGRGQQLVTLDRAGGMFLNIENYRYVKTLPITYNHTLLVVSTYLSAKDLIAKWKPEYNLRLIRPDAAFTLKGTGKEFILEVDTGKQSKPKLTKKLETYSKIKNLPPIIFISERNLGDVKNQGKELGMKILLSNLKNFRDLLLSLK